MVIIVGCNHGIQGAIEHWNFCLTGDQIQKAVRQRRRFGQMLERLIQESQPGLIAEEWGRRECTAAKGVARRKKIEWANVNTTKEERAALDIPACDYASGDYCKQQVAFWNGLRERVMFRKTRRLKNPRGPALVICGFYHVDGLRRLFRKAGERVLVMDYRRSPWYEADAFSD